MGCGEGKALVTLLAPVVMGAERPVLFVPAQLREQTLQRVIPEMRQHWKLHPNLAVIGYSELSLAHKADLLDRLQPDLIMMDESHYLKNAAAGRTKRVRRYMKEHPATRVLAVSGTHSRKSLRDYHRTILWALKDDFCPMPAREQEMKDWADALDEGVEDARRVRPGALMLFCQGEETAREGFRRRLTSTPGVVATRATQVDVSLRLYEFKPEVPASVHQHLHHLRTSWETPNGDLVTEAIDLWRHAREIACGYWSRWDPAAPQDWLDARRAWKKYVRDTLQHNRRQLETELQVWNECRNAKTPPVEWEDWVDIQDQFEPNPVAEWLSDYLVDAAAQWMAERDAEGVGGVVWTEHVPFAERLAQKSRRPYFGAGKRASAEILYASGSVIASIQAHSEGKNLVQWSRALVPVPPSSGKTWEQMLARHHRAGQAADEVVFEIGLQAEELRASLRSAVSEAKYLEQTLGARQRLLFADMGMRL